MGEIIYLPNTDLTSAQKAHWEAQLEIAHAELETAARRVEDCMRVLGLIELEAGLDD